MNRIAKFTLGGCIIVIVLIVGIVGASRLLAPAVIKAELSRQVYQLTGHLLTIHGDVRWSFFPWLGIKAENVVLDNQSEFGQTPLAKAANVQMSVRLLPLFSHQLEVSNIFIDDFTLYLVKNSQGKANWVNLLASASSQKHLPAEREHSSHFDMFRADFVQLKRGKVYFDNQQTHQRIELDKLNFSAEDIALNKDFPINLAFAFKRRSSSSGTMQINSALKIDAAKKQFNFSNLICDTSWSNAQGIRSTLHATSNLVYMSDTTKFVISQLTAKLNDNDYSFTGDLSGILSPKFSAQGHLNSTALLVGAFLFKDVQTHINIKNAIISLSSVTANLYGGHYTGDILINTQPSMPIVTFNGMLKQADVGMLFSQVMNRSSHAFTGTIDISSMLKFTLGTADTTRRTLNGNITVRLQNGALHGVNIPALIELGQAILKQKTFPIIASNQTDFGVIKGTFQIQNGVMLNQDLTLQSSQLMANGQGKIDLVNHQIDYHLNAGLIGRKVMVPILIRGSISQPVIAPDFKQVASEVLNQQANQLITEMAKPGEADKLKKKLNKELNKLNLGGLLG